MPIQSQSTTDQIVYSDKHQTWVIDKDVDVVVESNAVFSNYSYSMLINKGDISSNLGYGADFESYSAMVFNEQSGSIVGETGVRTTGNVGFGGQIVNYGEIVGFGYDGIFSLNDSLIQNSGLISGAKIGIETNGGTLTNAVNATIFGTKIGVFGESVISNSGTIEGTTAISSSALSLTNHGLIDGDVVISGSATSKIVNSGSIVGDITFGAGADTYDGRLGTISGAISGGDGSDVFRGGAGEEVFNGGGGADRFNGGLGGGDTFVYTSYKDSTQKAFDVIKNFDLSDTFDLTAVDADTTIKGQQHLTFGGMVDPGSRLPANEVVYTQSAGNTYVLADVNGDGFADLQIQIHGTYTLTAAQFDL